MLQRLIYDVENDGTGNFLFYIKESVLANLDLPVKTKDSISSFALSYSLTQCYFNRGNDRQIMFEYVCSKIMEMLEKYWEPEFGVPVISFRQYPIKLAEVFNRENIVVFFNKNNSVIDTEMWQKALSSLHRINFVAEFSEFGFSIITCDHKFVYSWLNQRKYIKKICKPINKLTVDFKMKTWFPNAELRETLKNKAREIINKFVIAKSFNIFIPEFLIIESFHAKRFKISHEILTSKYSPEFIMTLPMLYNDMMYTILFPVCEKFTKNNIRGF